MKLSNAIALSILSLASNTKAIADTHGPTPKTGFERRITTDMETKVKMEIEKIIASDNENNPGIPSVCEGVEFYKARDWRNGHDQVGVTWRSDNADCTQKLTETLQINGNVYTTEVDQATCTWEYINTTNAAEENDPPIIGLSARCRGGEIKRAPHIVIP